MAFIFKHSVAFGEIFLRTLLLLIGFHSFKKNVEYMLEILLSRLRFVAASAALQASRALFEHRVCCLVVLQYILPVTLSFQLNNVVIFSLE